MKRFLCMIFYLLLTMSCMTSYSQGKPVEDCSVITEVVPQEAINYLEAAEIEETVSWYHRKDFHDNWYEAIFDYNDYQFKVVFNTEGIMTDIFIIKPHDQIDQKANKSIRQALAFFSDSCAIQQFQEHYIGEHDYLLRDLIEKPNPYFVEMIYEINVRGKHLDNEGLYILTFTDKGYHISTQQIIAPVSDDLDN